MKFRINLQKVTKFAATLGALFTMVMSPVALGREAQKITVKQLQAGLDEAGLNKQVTVGEFYKKNKHLIPERLRKEFETFVSAYKNQMMPQFEVVATKGTDGVEVANLRLTQGNEIVTIQMLGGADKYAKIQNTFVTEVDVINFNDMFKRVIAGDEKYRKQYESLIAPSPSAAKGVFTGFPDLTVATWKGMSQKERAAYMINMRMLWNDARRVLIEAERKDKKGRKTSSYDASPVEKMDAFFALFSTEVEAKGVANKAASAQKSGGVSPLVKQGKASSAFVSGSNCLVAGYVSRYSATKCGVDGIFDSYRDPNGGTDKLVESVNQACASVGIACNPYVYGTPGGKPICVSTKDSSFQVATHYDGPCDSQSRLGSSIPFLNDESLKNSKRYSAENMALTKEKLEDKYKQEQKANPKLVEDYLNGLLAYNKTSGVDFTKPLNDEVLGALLKVKQNFDNDINKAKASCEAAASNKNNEKNFWGACDQLHRRFLNVAQFLETTPGCGGGKINPDTLRCACPSGPEALPGTKCGTPQPPMVCPVIPVGPPQQDCVPGTNPVSGDQTKPGTCEKEIAGVSKEELDGNCNCIKGGPPKRTVEFEGIEQFTCVGAEPAKPGEKENKCEWLCKLGTFAKKVLLPVGIGIAAIFVLKKIFEPKKPKLSSPGDLCPNGSTAPCPQACPDTNHVLVNGVCGCRECPIGQSANTSCVCSSTPAGSTEYTCGDGVTKTTDPTLANCPVRQYDCWDGSKVTNLLNCPEKPSSNSAPKSGSGKTGK